MDEEERSQNSEVRIQKRTLTPTLSRRTGRGGRAEKETLNG